jgi:hypothetical protein
MGRVSIFAICGLLLAAPLAVAQSPDAFREATPPTASAPTVPRPRPSPEAVAPQSPEPAVAPAPTLPSAGQIWARVRQVAQAEGIGVPLAGIPAFDVAGTPPQYRALLGAWGPGAWQGNPGGKMILIVQSADGDGNVKGVIGTNAGSDSWYNFTTRLSGDRFTVHFQQSYYKSGFMPGTEVTADNYWPFELRADGKVYGSRDNGALAIVLPRLQ